MSFLSAIRSVDLTLRHGPLLRGLDVVVPRIVNEIVVFLNVVFETPPVIIDIIIRYTRGFVDII
jgi:hypothetical protein